MPSFVILYITLRYVYVISKNKKESKMMNAYEIREVVEVFGAVKNHYILYVVTDNDGIKRIMAFNFCPLTQQNVHDIHKKNNLIDCSFEKIPKGFQLVCTEHHLGKKGR